MIDDKTTDENGTPVLREPTPTMDDGDVTPMRDDGDGGGDPEQEPTFPPTVASYITSVAQQGWAKPYGQTTVVVQGRVDYTDGEPASEWNTIQVQLTVGGTSQTFSLSSWGGTWSRSVLVSAGASSGAVSVTAKAIATYKVYTSGIARSVSDTETTSIHLAVDGAGPSVPVSIPGDRTYTCPPPNGIVSVAVSGTASDNQSGLAWLGVGTDPNNLPGIPVNGGAWQTTVNLPARLGAHTIYVRAVDHAGNWTSSDQVVTQVDRMVPDPKLDAPPRLVYDNAPLSLPVSGTVVDLHSGIQWVKVTLKGNDGSVIVADQTASLLDPHGPGQTSRWSTTLTIPAPGDYTVSVRAADTAGNVTQHLVSAPVHADPIPEPTVVITSHRTGDVVPGDDMGAHITLRGTASAPLSTLQKVQVRVGDEWQDEDEGFVDADPEAGDWSQWKADVHIPPEGTQTVLVRATNAAANTESKHGHAVVTLRVGVAYGPQEGADSTTLKVYFRDLRKFALRRIRITDASGTRRALLPADLVRDFFQPFDPLAADEQVAQIRLCIEVLRRYLAVMQRTPSAAGEAEYRELAYRSLLVQFGTSYEELRASRTASQSEREALAERLGIDPAHLAELFLAPDAVTEAALESIFGLRDTDPTTPGTPGLPLLFRRQVESLRALWRRQDQPAGGAAATPVLDPDLVSVDNIPESKRVSANLAYALLTERAGWLQEHLDGLAADVQQGESGQARLARLVGAAVQSASMDDLLALEQDRVNGVDVVPALAAHGLSLPAFAFLVRMHAAAGSGALLPSEWSEVHSLLAGLEKRRRYAEWRAAEGALVLGPDDFQATLEQPRLPAWRATPDEWRAWQEKLRARTDQMETVRRAYQESIEAAEAAALPALRDVLVAAAGADADEGVDVANWLTQRLMVDVKGSSALRTTRATQAIETLQGILAALRAGRFMEMDAQLGPLPLGTWTLTVPDVPEARVGEVFDQEWAWMGSFSSWRAAMRVFLYPENLLLPGLRTQVTSEFGKMLAAGGTSRLSAQGARDMAAAYLEELAKNAPVWQGLAALRASWREQTYVLDERIAEAHLLARATAIREMMIANDGAQPLHRYLEELFFYVPMQLGLLLHRAGQFTAALDWFRTVYGYNLPVGQRKVFFGLKQEEENPCTYQTTDQWLRTTLNPHDIAPERAGAFTRFTLLSIARCFVEFGDVEFANESGEATARARTLYLGALELLGSADMRLPDGDDPATSFGFAANPEAVALRMHAELNLFKLRNGRNIAGMQRQSARGLDTGRGAAGPAALQPTPYRFPVLVDRAKQLVGLAQQMEAQYLAALEKKDAETYNLIRARHDLSVTQATVHLQELRIGEASGGVSLAALQQSRATVQKSTYQQWINGGEIQAEKDLLQGYRDVNRYRNWTAGVDAALATAQALTTASSGGFLGSGLGAGLGGAVLVGALSASRAGLVMAANNAEARVQANSFRASYERRKQEWQLQASLAEKDEAIGAQQMVQAQHHLQIVSQERTIAQMQANNAHATVEFLANKFTNAELYEWMSGVLGRVYSYFLQQATAIARLAEAQLAFERQEKPLSVIRADYWEASAETGAGAMDGGTERDRRGLTGSARLLQDIYKLDQYAFETNKRKLQLSKTVSLAQLAPYELEQFRRTGSLVFATPMELFDRDFPGHYLRLVRRVRTSVVALIPPHQGIRATLSASGLSRVTVADGGFQTVVLRRDPEAVALTSPNNATGLFELDPQAELLMPFEGMGVDTTWTLEMPRASNPFDFGTVADVLLTVEYTALHSYDYRQQVVRTLGTRVSAERAFSFRDAFPDQWYDLANGAANTPATVDFTVRRDDFPPNVDGLRVESLLLHFVPKNGAPVAARATDLRFPTVEGTGSAGAAEAVEGVISTRRNRWTSVVGARPVAGGWRLELDAETAQRFRAGEVEDLLLVVGYAGEGPAWT